MWSYLFGGSAPEEEAVVAPQPPPRAAVAPPSPKAAAAAPPPAPPSPSVSSDGESSDTPSAPGTPPSADATPTSPRSARGRSAAATVEDEAADAPAAATPSKPGLDETLVEAAARLAVADRPPSSSPSPSPPPSPPPLPAVAVPATPPPPAPMVAPPASPLPPPPAGAAPVKPPPPRSAFAAAAVAALARPPTPPGRRRPSVDGGVGSSGGGEAGVKRANSRLKLVRFAEGVVDAASPLVERFACDGHYDGRLVWAAEPANARAGGGALFFDCVPSGVAWTAAAAADKGPSTAAAAAAAGARPSARGGVPPRAPAPSLPPSSPAADNGHFLHVPLVYDDFVMTTSVRFAHAAAGDAAGLLVRVNAGCWLRVAAQATEPGGAGAAVVAVVANDGLADASVAAWAGAAVNEISLRVRREGRAYHCDARFPGRRWTTVRSLRLGDDRLGGPVAAGLFAAAPAAAGASAEFSCLRIEPGRVLGGAVSSGSLVG